MGVKSLQFYGTNPVNSCVVMIPVGLVTFLIIIKGSAVTPAVHTGRKLVIASDSNETRLTRDKVCFVFHND